MAVAQAAAQEAAEAAAAGYAAKLEAAREEAAGQMASELQAAAQEHEAALSTLTTEHAQALEAAREEAAQAVEAQWAQRYDAELGAEVERCRKELEAGYREAMVAPRKFGALAVEACEALKKRKPLQATKSLKEAAQYAIDLELVIQKVVKLSPEEQAHADAMAAAAQAVL
eukprot:COSAG01_NODE_13390_length_1591_cov_49.707301_2_plen_171_part_00